MHSFSPDSISALQAPVFRPYSLGQIAPRGWLHHQLQTQASGLTGHLDEFWPSVKDSRWIGGDCEGWERGPYWLDGLIPLAFLLEDERLKAKAQRWIDYILATQHDDGWLGAKNDSHVGEGQSTLDPWPLFIVFKAFLAWRDATNDARIVPALLRCARRVQLLLENEPLRSWAQLRWADFALSLHTLYEISGENWLLELAATCREQGYNWRAHFADLPMKRKCTHADLGENVGLPLHGVNNAMGLKTGAVWWRQSADSGDAQSVTQGLRELETYHGAPTGMFYADEHLAGRAPTQGYETCAVVEEMFSLEVAGAITGEGALFERLAQIAFNALPAQTTPDFWAHQYHGQTNQVLCSDEPRAWTDAGTRANCYGQDLHFGCCEANLHQGWPKWAQSVWLRSQNAEICAALYAPSLLKTQIGGTDVQIEQLTAFPFGEHIKFRVKVAQPVQFALRGFVPSWAKGATLDGQTVNEHWRLEREWHDGDEVELHLPFSLRLEERENRSVCVHFGPLLLALPIAEEFSPLGSPYAALEARAQEWAVSPRSAWNYALDLSAQSPIDHFAVEWGETADAPFAPQNSPLRVRARARRIENWKMECASAGPIPAEPVANGPEETVSLVPFGATHLRIAQFPTLRK